MNRQSIEGELILEELTMPSESIERERVNRKLQQDVAILSSMSLVNGKKFHQLPGEVFILSGTDDCLSLNRLLILNGTVIIHVCYLTIAGIFEMGRHNGCTLNDLSQL